MPQEGQRTRSSRWSHDHPGNPGKPDTGQRGLDIPGIRIPEGQQYAATTEGNSMVRKWNNPAGVGAPDVVKATCPVRGGLGGTPLLKSSKDAVLLLHHYWRFVDSEALELKALSQGVAEQAA